MVLPCTFFVRDERLHLSLYNQEPDTEVKLTNPSSSHVSSCCDCTLTTWYGSVLDTDIERVSSYRRHYYSRRDLSLPRRRQGHPSRYILPPTCRHLWVGKHTWFSLALFLFCFRDRLSASFSLQPRAGHRGRVGISIFVTRLELL